jgi:hypothetical protein
MSRVVRAGACKRARKGRESAHEKVAAGENLPEASLLHDSVRRHVFETRLLANAAANSLHEALVPAKK